VLLVVLSFCCVLICLRCLCRCCDLRGLWCFGSFAVCVACCLRLLLDGLAGVVVVFVVLLVCIVVT